MSEAALKQLKVKVSSVKRNIKDLKYARTEVKKEEGRLAQVQKDTPDEEFRIRQQQQVIHEARVMVPDARNRIDKAVTELKAFLAEIPADVSKEDPQMVAANEAIAEAAAALEEVDE